MQIGRPRRYAKDGGRFFFSNMLHTWLKLKAKHDDDHKDITPNSPLWNNSNLQYKQKNLHMKDWIHKGIYQIKDILDDQNNLIPFQELENLVGRAPHRLLEYNAVNTTLQQARQHNRLHLSNKPCEEDSHNMTINGTPVASLSKTSDNYSRKTHNLAR